MAVVTKRMHYVSSTIDDIAEHLVELRLIAFMGTVEAYTDVPS